MQVAHGVHLHDVDESREQEKVTRQANQVLRHVEEEVNGSQKHWEQIDAQHYHTAQGKD